MGIRSILAVTALLLATPVGAHPGHPTFDLAHTHAALEIDPLSTLSALAAVVALAAVRALRRRLHKRSR